MDMVMLSSATRAGLFHQLLDELPILLDPRRIGTRFRLEPGQSAPASR